MWGRLWVKILRALPISVRKAQLEEQSATNRKGAGASPAADTISWWHCCNRSILACEAGSAGAEPACHPTAKSNESSCTRLKHEGCWSVTSLAGQFKLWNRDLDEQLCEQEHCNANVRCPDLKVNAVLAFGAAPCAWIKLLQEFRISGRTALHRASNAG